MYSTGFFITFYKLYLIVFDVVSLPDSKNSILAANFQGTFNGVQLPTNINAQKQRYKSWKTTLTLNIWKKIIAKLILLYNTSFIQGNLTWDFRHTVVLLWFLHDRAVFSWMYFQSSSICNTILLYILLMYSYSFLVYFLLFVLRNQLQVFWHKTLLKKCSPYPDLYKLPALSALLQHSRTCAVRLSMQSPQN